MKNLLADFSRTKSFDLLMASPLVLWFGYNAINLRPALSRDARWLLADPLSLYNNLHFFSLASAIGFNLLLVWLLLTRSVPVGKSKGLLPRVCAFVGSFLAVGISHFPPADLSLGWQTLATFLTLVGFAGSLLVLARLGKSFSVMPEARRLVTDGPYAYARHPLYAVEIIAVAGLGLQYQQPWAGLLALAVVVLQVLRSLFEEQVLAENFPEYESYRARTARFIPGVL